MLPLITQQDFLGKTSYTLEHKHRYKRGSQGESSTHLNPKAVTHTTFQTNKASSLIRYSKIESKMYQSNLTQQIKDIDKKIRQCERRIQKEKAKSQIERETQFIKKSTLGNFTGFDFLTNPKMEQEEQEEEEEEPISQIQSERVIVQPKQSIKLQGQEFVKQKNQYLDKHYSNDLKKKFQRRSMMPHMPCKRKVPKLHITKNNQIQKSGKVENETEHIFRVLSKEATPIEIYPTIPNFATVKDTVSKNISAYLTDYKPFIQKVAKVSNEVV